MGCGPPSTLHPEGTSLVYGTRDLLPDATLVDQHGRKLQLPALKGRLVLVNFVDTACGERCAPFLASLAFAADRVSNFLGESIFFVSISSEPERDSPRRLLGFARAAGCEHPGWLFLTGPRAEVDRVMGPFGIIALSEQWLSRQNGQGTGPTEPFGWSALREQSEWGSQATFAYLLNRSGRLRRIYDLSVVRKQSLAFDLVRLLPYGDTE